MPTRFDKIQPDRFGLFQEISVYREVDILFREDRIVFFRLIQSHCQRRRASTGLEKDSHRAWSLLVFHKLLDHLRRFFRDFYHDFFLRNKK
ncbi:hypothetical cytosolic protein [Syntrophus aciditrophicus SB]|uniref:Hypothetical cytosolic protein n=1 Tax=Syntrophus aciditrophicus (strain SB) TaxID=56780 RepID=Q2LXK5_SYNAS|nr:hypothetical cytosolic protein [Syntrophus aciditrophicus SB]